MKGRIFDIKRFAVHDGPGIRTTVFFKGCPLHCLWCHNPESQSSETDILYRGNLCIQCGRCVAACGEDALSLTAGGLVRDRERCTRCGDCVEACPSGALESVGQTISAEDLVAGIAKDTLFFDQSGGGVTFSGGEPLAQPAFLCEMLDRCGEREIHRAVDTTGYTEPAVLRDVAERTDLFLFDIKLVDSDRHRECTGVPNTRILENLRLLDAMGCRMEIRLPVIPGITDTEANIEGVGERVASLGTSPAVRLLPHHRTALSKCDRFGIPNPLPETPEPSAEEVKQIADKLERYGLVVKTG